MYTVADLEKRYGVNETTVLGWIKSGELKALNVGRTSRKRSARGGGSANPRLLKPFEADADAGPTGPTPLRPAAGRRRDRILLVK